MQNNKILIIIFCVDSYWVWRSLVARLNGVQEAASSILVTPTKKRTSSYSGDVFFHKSSAISRLTGKNTCRLSLKAADILTIQDEKKLPDFFGSFWRIFKKTLHVEAEEDDVAVLHDVIFTFGADFAFFFGGGKRAAI